MSTRPTPRDTAWPNGDTADRTRSFEVLGDEAPAISIRGERTPTLTCVEGRSLGRVFKLSHSDMVLGREGDVHIAVPDDGVSRKHAQLTLRAGTWSITDLGSTNGTFLNEQRLRDPAELAEGDCIRLGVTTILRFGYQDRFDAQIQERLYELATRDPLTRAFNRHYLDERLVSEWAWAKRQKRPCAVCAIDADFFKRVNDDHGHAAGDFVLCEIATIVRGVIRAEDTFARLGGEEFCVLARATDGPGARMLGERIRAAIANHVFDYAGQQIPVTISVGLCVSTDEGITSHADLMRRADEALYRAKHAGRNRVSE